MVPRILWVEVGRGMGLPLAKMNLVLVRFNMSPVTCPERVYSLLCLELYHKKSCSVPLSWWDRERQHVTECNSPCNTGETCHLSSKKKIITKVKSFHPMLSSILYFCISYLLCKSFAAQR